MAEDQIIQATGIEAPEAMGVIGGEPEKPKVIYGDGKWEVSVQAGAVVFTRQQMGEGISYMKLSRAAFREIVIGWDRFLEQEDE
jgi:hypothetical protein